VSCRLLAGRPSSGQSNPAQTATQQQDPKQTDVLPAVAPAAKSPFHKYLTSKTVPNEGASRYYRLVWGIENIQVKEVSSGASVSSEFLPLWPMESRGCRRTQH
jgi:hypothetical protein